MSLGYPILLYYSLNETLASVIPNSKISESDGLNIKKRSRSALESN